LGRGKLQLATRGGDQPTHENSRIGGWAVSETANLSHRWFVDP
jgi:hypothetical protein